MVDHARRSVRDAAIADLAGLATTGANVFASRLSPLEESEMPGWYVMLRDEDASEANAIGAFERNGQLVIEGWALGSDGLEDLLDTMAAEAEAALYAADGTMMALLHNFGAPRTQQDMPATGTSGQAIGKVRLLIPVTYRTAIADPTTLI